MCNEAHGGRYSDCRASEFQNVQMVCARVSSFWSTCPTISLMLNIMILLRLEAYLKRVSSYLSRGYSWLARLICIVFVKSLILHSWCSSCILMKTSPVYKRVQCKIHGTINNWLLAPQSGALRISAYRDFQSNPTQSHTHPLIAFGHLSLSIVIRNNASRPRQINVD